MGATTEEIPGELLPPLKTLHARLAVSNSRWGKELEGSYLPLPALRRYDPDRAMHPYIERGGVLRVEQHGSDMVIQFHVLREHGIAHAGPPPHTLIDPILPDELKRAVQEILRTWWGPMLHDPARLHHPG